jgi:FMN phosphatase YigB (HAD superfamily)
MRSVSKQRVSLCVFDLDNTLFDWVEIWHSMFSAKLAEVARISGISEEVLKPEFKAIHQYHATTEYPFAIQQLPSLIALHPGEDLRQLYDSAFHAYYRARRKTLKTYEGVTEVLQELGNRGVKLVAYTESMAFYSAQRLRDLNLDLLIEVLYSPEDHQLPNNMTPEQVRQYPPEHYQLRKTIHRHTPKGELKPNPDILRTILKDVGVPTEHAIYVGDSLMKDCNGQHRWRHLRVGEVWCCAVSSRVQTITRGHPLDRRGCRPGKRNCAREGNLRKGSDSMFRARIRASRDSGAVCFRSLR